MSSLQESEVKNQRSVDQELQFSEFRMLVQSDRQANAAVDSFLSWDDLIGQR